MDHLIITNNPLIIKTYIDHEIIQVKHYKEILTTARDHIHQGAKLLSHPQAGSIKPYETPYRTIIISRSQATLDFDSLNYIESALERFTSLSTSMGTRHYDEQSINDFQVIDEGLLRSALMSLNK